MTLFFVTPAFGRYALSEVCFEQRVRVIETLRKAGVEARCVVIADDENLDLARERGFATVEQNNDYLGRKFNDGIEYACRNGASRIVPIGSDSWVDPAYFLPMLPRRRATRTSRLYCVVTPDRIAELVVNDAKGAGPYVLPRFLLRASEFRPADDERQRGIDRSTVKGLRPKPRWVQHDLHPYQYIGFRGVPHLTPYRMLVDAWGVAEHTDPWAILAKHYPVDLVERARLVMADQVEVPAA